MENLRKDERSIWRGLKTLLMIKPIDVSFSEPFRSYCHEAFINPDALDYIKWCLNARKVIKVLLMNNVYVLSVLGIDPIIKSKIENLMVDNLYNR